MPILTIKIQPNPEHAEAFQRCRANPAHCGRFRRTTERTHHDRSHIHPSIHSSPFPHGKELTNVEEYCISERWVKVPAGGKAVDRKGQPLMIKLKGTVEAFYKS